MFRREMKVTLEKPSKKEETVTDEDSIDTYVKATVMAKEVIKYAVAAAILKEASHACLTIAVRKIAPCKH